MYIGLRVKYSLLLSGFNKTRNVLDRFSNHTQIPSLMKIRPVGDDLFHANGRTDRHDEGNGRFSQFCDHNWQGYLLASI
jgi:hypothetical protein